MGLFSEQKTCRHSSMCTCGSSAEQKNKAASPCCTTPKMSVKVSGGAEYTSKKYHPPSDAATSTVAKPKDTEEYINYIQKKNSKTSPVVIRGLVYKHLKDDPTMSMHVMLKKIREQLKQI